MTVFAKLIKILAAMWFFEDEELAILTRYWNIEKYQKTILFNKIFELFVKVPRKYYIDAEALR
jgi:hypothetical protein